jgi:hypothetical protein
MSPEEMQKMAIPPAEENTAGQSALRGKPPTPNTREQVMKQIQEKGSGDINMGGRSPHAVNGINPNAPAVKDNPRLQEMLKDAEGPIPVDEFPAPAMQPSDGNFDPLAPFHKNLEPGLHTIPTDIPAYEGRPTTGSVAYTPEPVACGRCKFLDADLKTVTLELTDGTFVIKAHKVTETKLSLAVMVPTGDAHFIPKAGTEIEVRHGEKAWDCYFPGTYVVYDDLPVMILVFVKKDPE